VVEIVIVDTENVLFIKDDIERDTCAGDLLVNDQWILRKAVPPRDLLQHHISSVDDDIKYYEEELRHARRTKYLLERLAEALWVNGAFNCVIAVKDFSFPNECENRWGASLVGDKLYLYSPDEEVNPNEILDAIDERLKSSEMHWQEAKDELRKYDREISDAQELKRLILRATDK
jgi:hypothetical protein